MFQSQKLAVFEPWWIGGCEVNLGHAPLLTATPLVWEVPLFTLSLFSFHTFGPWLSLLILLILGDLRTQELVRSGFWWLVVCLVGRLMHNVNLWLSYSVLLQGIHCLGINWNHLEVICIISNDHASLSTLGQNWALKHLQSTDSTLTFIVNIALSLMHKDLITLIFLQLLLCLGLLEIGLILCL